MDAFFVAAVCILVVLIFAAVKEIRRRNVPRFSTTIPGLRPTDPIQGNLADLAKHGSLYGFVEAMHSRYGDIVSFWFRKQFVVSIANHKLFKEQSNVSWRPEILFEMYEPLFGPESIQYCNSADLSLRHGAYSRVYSDTANTKYFTLIYECTQECLRKWDAFPSGEHISLKPQLFNLAARNMFLCSYGKRLDDTTVNRIQHSYDMMFDYMESWFVPNTAEEERIRKQDFAKQTLEERTGAAPGDQPLLVDAILNLGTSDLTKMCDMATFAIGGTHTSAFLMTWAFHYMACDQKIQDKVFAEILRVIGPEDEAQVTPQNYAEFTYLRQVLKETLRRQPVGPYAARYRDVDSTLGGHFVPAGTPVIQALGVAFRDKTVFPDPDKFNPDRFSATNSASIPAFAFEPFGFAGMRRCPGWKFAYVEATVVLTAILRRFRISAVPGQKAISPVYGLTSKPGDDIWVTISKRD